MSKVWLYGLILLGFFILNRESVFADCNSVSTQDKNVLFQEYLALNQYKMKEYWPQVDLCQKLDKKAKKELRKKMAQQMSSSYRALDNFVTQNLSSFFTFSSYLNPCLNRDLDQLDGLNQAWLSSLHRSIKYCDEKYFDIQLAAYEETQDLLKLWQSSPDNSNYLEKQLGDNTSVLKIVDDPTEAEAKRFQLKKLWDMGLYQVGSDRCSLGSWKELKNSFCRLSNTFSKLKSGKIWSWPDREAIDQAAEENMSYWFDEMGLGSNLKALNRDTQNQAAEITKDKRTIDLLTAKMCNLGNLTNYSEIQNQTDACLRFLEAQDLRNIIENRYALSDLATDSLDLKLKEWNSYLEEFVKDQYLQKLKTSYKNTANSFSCNLKN
ncbi:MAG TPA: hypothetical protein PLQ36_02905 [Candidatus Gracilibacteria bacterium]|nr:hypothetical protein [Candidatus Gracilibacteria bacterium]